MPKEAVVVSINPDYYSYTPDEWEVPRDKVKLLQEIGNGSFGKVFLGSMIDLATAKETLVAVKVCSTLLTMHKSRNASYILLFFST